MARTGRDQQAGPDGDRSESESAGDQWGGPNRDQSPKQAPRKGSAHKNLRGPAGTQMQTAPGGLPWDQHGVPDGDRSPNVPKRSIRVDRSQHTFCKDWELRSRTDPETGQIEKEGASSCPASWRTGSDFFFFASFLKGP